MRMFGLPPIVKTAPAQPPVFGAVASASDAVANVATAPSTEIRRTIRWILMIRSECLPIPAASMNDNPTVALVCLVEYP